MNRIKVEDTVRVVADLVWGEPSEDDYIGCTGVVKCIKDKFYEGAHGGPKGYGILIDDEKGPCYLAFFIEEELEVIDED